MTFVWILVGFAILASVVGAICIAAVGRTDEHDSHDSEYIWIDVDSDDPGIKQTKFVKRPKVGEVFSVENERTEAVDYFLIDEVDHINGMMECHILRKEEFEDALQIH